jgi:hypothetical protein
MQTVIIEIDWESDESISRAEKEKLELENRGFKRANSFGGMRFTRLIMIRGD